MTEVKKCALCGDDYHAEPDPPDMAWMGLICPGANADDETKLQFRADLCVKYAEYILRQTLREMEIERWEREAAEAYRNRKRSDVTAEQLQAHADTALAGQIEQQPWLSINPEAQPERAAAQIAADELAELAGSFIEPPHLQVPPSVVIKPPSAPLQQDIESIRAAQEEMSKVTKKVGKDADYLLFLKGDDE